MDTCPLCGKKPYTINIACDSRDVFSVECRVCGKYNISGEAIDTLNENKYRNKKYILAGIIRENNKYTNSIEILSDNIDKLLASMYIPTTIFQKMERIVLYIGDEQEKKLDTTAYAKLNGATDYPITFSYNEQEFGFLIGQLVKSNKIENPGEEGSRLTIKGWEEYYEIQKRQIRKDQVFVAMSFDESMDHIYENGIEPTLLSLGYKVINMKKLLHNELICNRMIAEIRKSGLIVADFTNNKHNVYFEAGFALGLGIPVIWACNKEYFEKTGVQFDTNQYSHIIWEDSKELKTLLIDMIEANIPNRPKPLEVK